MLNSKAESYRLTQFNIASVGTFWEWECAVFKTWFMILYNGFLSFSLNVYATCFCDCLFHSRTVCRGMQHAYLQSYFWSVYWHTIVYTDFQAFRLQRCLSPGVNCLYPGSWVPCCSPTQIFQTPSGHWLPCSTGKSSPTTCQWHWEPHKPVRY